MTADHVRVRFAPSPTGFLHLGGARTALYNWIYARRYGGDLVLRIEDTDPTRSTDEAIRQILASLRELGLDWDEGPDVGGPYGPYRQTQRQGVYEECLSRLVAEGHAYFCFCTPEELEAERTVAVADKRGWVYGGRCRDLPADEVARRVAAGEPAAKRFKIPPGTTVVDDMLRAPVEFANETIGDFIIRRSDGTFTYNLAVVADDVSMAISHVIRGDDHLSNTPKQVLIYEALGEPVPRFLHIPLLFGTDRKKLSKRHGATTVEELTAEGFLPEVVRNYLVLLSSEFDESMVSWTLDDLVTHFDLEQLNTSATIFDPEKLRWMNGRFIREMDPDALAESLLAYLTRVGFFAAETSSAKGMPDSEAPTLDQRRLVLETAPLVQEKIELLSQFPALAGFFFRPQALPGEAAARLAAIPSAKLVLETAAVALAQVEPFDVDHVEAAVRSLPERLGVKAKSVFAALRLGMSGQSVTPGLFESLVVLGRDEAAGRLATAAAFID
jgi:nondiscriminating glutamyl-tRNA synthetase